MSYFLGPKPSESKGPSAKATRASSLRERSSGKVGEDNQRPSSLGEWVKGVLPSKRPERGGTIRKHGYWEKVEAEGVTAGAFCPRRYVSDTGKSRRTETIECDRIVRWNTARDVSTSHLDEVILLKDKAEPHTDASPASGRARTWSWAPRYETPEQLAVKSPPADSQASISSNLQPPADPRKNASHSPGPLTAERRLSRARRLIEAKKESRRQRRRLQESGDYLGVQGINPETGELDIITPTNSDRSSADQDTEQRIHALRSILKATGSARKSIWERSEKEANRLIVDLETNKLELRKMEKEALKKDINKNVKWRRHTKQWSSAAEPDLSPIAQSLRSTTPDTRRQSQIPPTINEARFTGTPKLIDLSSPTREVHGYRRANAPPAPQRHTPTPTSTVIHTPHRQSLTDVSPSAWELYENGISFSPNASYAVGSSDKWTSPESPSTPRRYRRVTTQMEDVITASPERRGRTRFRAVPSPNANDTEAQRPVVKSSEESSFLELSRGRSPDVEGGVTSPMAKKQPAMVPTPWYSLSPRSTFPLLNRKAARLLGPKKIDTRNHTPEPGVSHTDRASSPPTAQAAAASGQIQGSRTDRSPFRKLIQGHILHKKKAGPTGAVETLQTRSADLPLHSMTNLNAVYKAQERAEEQKAESPEIADKIHNDLNALRQRVAKLDGMGIDTIGVDKDRESGIMDHNWIEESIRDINEKGKQAMEGSASTSIITTIGCDQRQSSLNQNQILFGQAVEELRTQRTRLSSQVICNPRLESFKTPDLNVSQEKSQPNTLQRSTPVAATPHAATTSMRQLGRTKERSERLVTRARGHGCPRGQQVMRSISSPLSTRELATPKPPKQMNKESPHANKRAEVTPGSTPTAPLSSNLILPRDTGSGEQQKTIVRRMITKDGVFILDKERSQLPIQPVPIRRVPGSYPDHLDAEEDIDDLSESTNVLEHWLGEGIVYAGTKAVVVAQRQTKQSLRLYWQAVRPILDSTSQFWQRNNRQEFSIADVFSVALAIPGVLFLTAALV